MHAAAGPENGADFRVPGQNPRSVSHLPPVSNAAKVTVVHIFRAQPAHEKLAGPPVAEVVPRPRRQNALQKLFVDIVPLGWRCFWRQLRRRGAAGTGTGSGGTPRVVGGVLQAALVVCACQVHLCGKPAAHRAVRVVVEICQPPWRFVACRGGALRAAGRGVILAVVVARHDIPGRARVTQRRRRQQGQSQ